MEVFLAFAFRDSHKPLVSYIDQLVTSELIKAVTGEGLGAKPLPCRTKSASTFILPTARAMRAVPP